MTSSGEPWRGRITYNGTDISSAATAAVEAFLGSATTSQFTRDATNLTVAYSGSATDYTYRRMILHYANLCVIAGGVDLFLLGSEFRGIETIRGPGWTKAGTTGGDGRVTWDYPFVSGLIQLSDDVRSVFDGAGLTKDLMGLHNLIAYSADWSVWMGYQHLGENGQWPHLDQLYGHSNIDLVSFDNYLPLSDWTTGDGGLDARNWLEPAPTGTWPPTSAGVQRPRHVRAADDLQPGLSQGEHRRRREFQLVLQRQQQSRHRPRSERHRSSRLAARRRSADASRETPTRQTSNCSPTSNCAGGGTTATRRCTTTEAARAGSRTDRIRNGIRNRSRSRLPNMGFRRPIAGTNQPNVFYDPISTESFTPFWSIWDPSQSVAGNYWPRRDDILHLLALQAVYEYWVTDGNNETSNSGVPMIQPAFMSVWNWDARPFPTFPQMDRRVGRRRQLAGRGIGSTARDRSSRRLYPTIRRRPDRIRLSRPCRRSDGRCVIHRSSRPRRRCMSRAARFAPPR